MSAADGPAGPQGAQGERGERGRSPHLPGRSIVILFLIAAGLAAFAIFWVNHAVNTEQGKWCSLVITLDEANASAAKRPAPGTFTAKFTSEIHELRQSLGCGS